MIPHANLDDSEGRRQRLLQLLCFVGVVDYQRVEVSAATNLELDHILGLLDHADRFGILPADDFKEAFDLVDLLGHE